MSFTQRIPFNQSKGGTVANLCLDNVRRGYGISNKYGSAWEAWQHTEQHPDRNVPSGLAVPIYYSYTVDLGDGPQNYGHINVQLPNGTVWSDGKIYPSIDGYLAGHAPKFVGWGESVNDFKVIGGDMDIAEGMINDNDDIAELWRFGFFREPSAQELQDYQVLIGKYWNDAIKYLRQTDAGKQVRSDYLSINILRKQLADKDGGAQDKLDQIKKILG